MQQLPKRVGFIMPDKYYTTLNYWKAIQLPNTGGGAFTYLVPSNAFDIDPALGSTALPGFTELAAIYHRYRVLKVKVTLEVTNTNNSNPEMILLLASNRDLGSPTITDWIHWKSNPLGMARTVGTVYSPPVKLTRTFSTEEIFGSKEIYTDTDFSGEVSGSPLNNWFLYLANYMFGSGVGTTHVNLSLDIGLEFFERKFLVG
jgi:hypothetical protein